MESSLSSFHRDCIRRFLLDGVALFDDDVPVFHPSEAMQSSKAASDFGESTHFCTDSKLASDKELECLNWVETTQSRIEKPTIAKANSESKMRVTHHPTEKPALLRSSSEPALRAKSSRNSSATLLRRRSNKKLNTRKVPEVFLHTSNQHVCADSGGIENGERAHDDSCIGHTHRTLSNCTASGSITSTNERIDAVRDKEPKTSLSNQYQHKCGTRSSRFSRSHLKDMSAFLELDARSMESTSNDSTKTGLVDATKSLSSQPTRNLKSRFDILGLRTRKSGYLGLKE